MSINWMAVARDVSILLALVFGSSFLAVQLAEALGTTSAADVVILSSLFWGVVSFTISGCLAQGNRWKHLAIVALTFWLVCVVNVVLGVTPVTAWLLSSLFILIIMGLGGSLSYLFVRPPKVVPVPAAGGTHPPTGELDQKS